MNVFANRQRLEHVAHSGSRGQGRPQALALPASTIRFPPSKPLAPGLERNLQLRRGRNRHFTTLSHPSIRSTS